MKKAVFILLCVLIGAGVLLWLAGPPLFYPRHCREIVEREAGEFGLDENLVYAVIKAESGFDEKARSHAGAQGLMQLTPQTFEWIASLNPPENGGEDILDPEDNIHCGCALLQMLLSRYGSAEVALCAYNAGMGTVDGWLSGGDCSSDGVTLDVIPYPETAAYVDRVERYWKRYGELYREGRLDFFQKEE